MPIKYIRQLRRKMYREFLNHLHQIGSETTTEEELMALYQQDVTIIFDNHRVDIAFNAAIYNELVDILTRICGGNDNE